MRLGLVREPGKQTGALHGRIPLAIEEGRLEAAAGVALSAKDLWV